MQIDDQIARIQRWGGLQGKLTHVAGMRGSRAPGRVRLRVTQVAKTAPELSALSFFSTSSEERRRGRRSSSPSAAVRRRAGGHFGHANTPSVALVELFHFLGADFRDRRPIFTKTDPNLSASSSPI
ncbi:hypothetical protein GQ457_03G022690 [Hibiscus cannabinus]